MRRCTKKKATPTLKKQKNINNGSHTSEYTQPERLSSLPDSICITILSLLPIDSAAATSVLSRRWQRLWTHITHLCFAPPWKLTSDEFQSFMTTVNHILFQLTSSKLHTFHLHFPGHLSIDELYERPSADYLSYLVPWFNLIWRRNAEVFKVSFQDVFPIRVFDLPNRFLESKSLVILELATNFEFKFHDDENLVIDLPNLKKLHMVMYDSHRRLMGKLFKSCPLLEDLYLSLDLGDDDHLVDISAPNLECLCIVMNGPSSNNCRFVIDAPNLEQLEIKGALAIFNFVMNPNNLQEVNLCLEKDSLKDENANLSDRLGLFQGICCVRSLILPPLGGIRLLDSLVDFGFGVSLPIFDNLIHLSVTCNDGDLDSDDINWSPQIPSCWLPKLKKIEVSDMLGTHDYEHEMNLLCNILSGATVLEQLHVSLFKYDEDESKPHQLWNEYNFCKEIFKLSRSSLGCRIEFSGNMITSSSNNFRNGELTCQIVE